MSEELKEALEVAQANEQEAKRLHVAGERVLKQAIVEKKQLQDCKTQLGEELKDVRAQLADSVKENKKLRGGIFSMCPNYCSSSSEIDRTDIIMIAGILTGRPEEEVSGLAGDLLQRLSRCTSMLGWPCGVLPRPYGHPPPLQEVWRSL